MSEEHKTHQDSSKKDSMTITKVGLWKGIAGVLAILLVFSIYTGGFGIKGGTSVAPSAPSAAQPAQPRAQPTQPSAAPSAPSAPTSDMAVLSDDDAVEGEANAPVTIVEWSDYECPFCARFYTQTLGQIRTEYIETGKVKLVYRDFPLGFHQNAQKAAEAAECAGEQDKYYELHNKLFEEGVTGGVNSFKQFAGDLGLDQADFDECLDSGAMAEEIKQDIADGQANGIRGTPGFIINGKSISGAQPFEAFKAVIDAELAK